jgi:hypothetical protein
MGSQERAFSERRTIAGENGEMTAYTAFSERNGKNQRY